MALVNVCTIVSRRDLARARVLAATLHAHQPEGILTVLLLDAEPQHAGEIEHAHTLALGDVVAEGGGLLAAANPPGALPIAVLPDLVRAIFKGGAESVIYVGAGQRVLGPLSELAALLRDSQVALVARAGLQRSAGGAVGSSNNGSRCAYSSSLFGLRAGPVTTTLLSAWPAYFADSGGDDGAGAVCAWLESVPAIVEGVGILRDSGYGLDAWTLKLRPVSSGAGVLEVGGRPARVLELGELDPRDPPSSFDGGDRIRLSSQDGLAELARRHGEDLLAAGYEDDQTHTPAFAQLGDGARLTPTMRALLIEAIEEGALRNSPFTQQGRVELYEFFNRPADRGADFGLTRLHMEIWSARADLRAGYPHIDGPDGAGFAGWLCLNGAQQEGLVAELLPPTPELAYRDANPHAHQDEPRWGVNVVGFFTAELGVGEAARLLISGLDAASVPALPIQGHLAPPSRQGEEFAYARIDEAAFPINILCINGDGVPVFAREAGRGFFEGRHTIAMWWWEVGDPPANWSPAYEFIDEVWVASQHTYDAIAPTSPVPVVRVKLPVLEPTVAERTRAQLGIPEEDFVFLYVHDYHSVAARKNPLGLIDAFRRAFPAGSGAKLVLKSINSETRPREHERVVLAASRHADITLLDAYVSGSEKNAIIAACDCYVSLHRSEGFGLTVAEAMLLGKPVIATRYGGTLEFTNDENSYLVRFEPTAVGEGAYPYAPQDVWAEPDLDDAAALMRHVLAHPEEARERGDLARRQMLEYHSPAVAGATMQRRLALINRRLNDEGSRSLNLTHLPSLQNAEAAPDIEAAPSIDWGTGWLGRVRRRAQAPVAAWAQSYVKHEVAIDLEADRAVARIDARLREVAQTLQEQQSAQHAETLAVLRRLQAELAELRDLDGVAEALRPEGSPDPGSASPAERPGQSPG
jgi:glycosyltransferase involved in cell wall biosynthesis